MGPTEEDKDAKDKPIVYPRPASAWKGRRFLGSPSSSFGHKPMAGNTASFASAYRPTATPSRARWALVGAAGASPSTPSSSAWPSTPSTPSPAVASPSLIMSRSPGGAASKSPSELQLMPYGSASTSSPTHVLEFRPCYGYQDYLVSSSGEVRSKQAPASAPALGSYTMADGRPAVKLRGAWGSVQLLRAVVVASAWIPGAQKKLLEKGVDVYHINKNKLDCNVTNLAVMTLLEAEAAGYV